MNTQTDLTSLQLIKLFAFITLFFCYSTVLAGPNCDGALKQIQAQMIQDEITLVEDDDIRLVDEDDDITLVEEPIFLFQLMELPAGYAESEKAFLEAKKRYAEFTEKQLEGIIDALETLQWSGRLSGERLALLSLSYDKAATPEKKIKILKSLIKGFSIAHEHEYLALFARTDLSEDFKNNLYVQLKKIFRTDPSWMPPLQKAWRDRT